MTALRLALAQYRVGRPRAVADFATRLDRLAAEAASGGAGLLLLPEYAAMEVAAALTDSADPHAELEAVVAHAPALLEGMRTVARRHGIWLQPGTLPWRDAAGTRNRAPLIGPDGRLAFQDKRVMTRFESEAWGVDPGDMPAVFDTPWGRIGIAICYDVEFPPLVRAQVAAGAWLILTPSCTDTQHGFNRVRLSARARAVENQCFVAVAPTVGDAPWSATLDANHGRAGAYGPVDRGFPEDGIIAEGPPDEAAMIFAELDPALLSAVRTDGAVRNHRDWPAEPPPCPVRTPS